MSEMTYKDVVRILNLIDNAKGVDIALENGDLKLTAKWARGRSALPDVQALPADQPPTSKQQAAGSQASLVTAAPLDDHLTAVKAPMGGMFYASSAPGQPPFAKVGQKINPGDQLGIVEVMKLFTPITAPCSGVVVEIRVEDHQTVAKDEILIAIDSEA